MKAIEGLRRKCNYSQDELALKLNVTQATISQWETGKSKPTTSNLLILADIFNCSIDEILERDITDSGRSR